MNPDFVKAVDPIIELMVDLKEKVEKNSAPAAEIIRDAFIRRFAESEKLLHRRPDEWNLARYALVGWIDEQLATSLSWPGAIYWNQNKLQVKYYRNQLARERFFQRAAEAEQLPQKDVLEVYFLCVVLGFQGVYNTAPGLQTPTDIGLPDRIEDWIRKTRTWFKLNPTKLPAGRSNAIEHDAAPLDGKYRLLSMGFVTFTTIVVTGLIVYAMIRGGLATTIIFFLSKSTN